jgi:hypothetical protein
MENGGKRPGAGRKPKHDEEKVNNIFNKALMGLYDKDTEEEAKIAFVKETLMTSQRGQIFIAEHVFGKAKETVDQNVNINNFSIKDVLKFD